MKIKRSVSAKLGWRKLFAGTKQQRSMKKTRGSSLTNFISRKQQQKGAKKTKMKIKRSVSAKLGWRKLFAGTKQQRSMKKTRGSSLTNFISRKQQQKGAKKAVVPFFAAKQKKKRASKTAVPFFAGKRRLSGDDCDADGINKCTSIACDCYADGVYEAQTCAFGWEPVDLGNNWEYVCCNGDECHTQENQYTREEISAPCFGSDGHMCTSKGCDCYADGVYEERTCKPGFHPEDDGSEDSMLYKCCNAAFCVNAHGDHESLVDDFTDGRLGTCYPKPISYSGLQSPPTCEVAMMVIQASTQQNVRARTKGSANEGARERSACE
jgi:hypothetical protein